MYIEQLIDSHGLKSVPRVVEGAGSIKRLGKLAREFGFDRTLLVSDQGLIDSGHVNHARSILERAGITVFLFHDFNSNPTSSMIELGRKFAEPVAVDSIIGLGGGSSLDTAKGINFVLTNGGTMLDYRGYGKTTKPMLPMIGIPTTAGTGSEAQSYALISDDETHQKMACGDPQAVFKAAILDPVLTVTQPRSVTVIAGYDAISHAVETFVTTRRNQVSQALSREAWSRLVSSFERVLIEPENIQARERMLCGSFLAGLAIENSMLGATHACANPLSSRFGIEHGVAIALMLPHVVRWNGNAVDDLYSELNSIAGIESQRGSAAEALAIRLEQLRSLAGLPETLQSVGVTADDFDVLAIDAAAQWTGQFNPRTFDEESAREIYLQALR